MSKRQESPRNPWMLLPTRSTDQDIALSISSFLPLLTAITCAASEKGSRNGKRSSRAAGRSGRRERPRQGEQVPASNCFMAEYAPSLSSDPSPFRFYPLLSLSRVLMIGQALISAPSSRPSTQPPRILSPTSETLWFNARSSHRRPKTFANSKTPPNWARSKHCSSRTSPSSTSSPTSQSRLSQPSSRSTRPCPKPPIHTHSSKPR